jgi:hypothetical protein
MDHSKHVRLAGSELTNDVLKDAAIYGADDHRVGTVSHIHGTGPRAGWLSTWAVSSVLAQSPWLSP